MKKLLVLLGVGLMVVGASMTVYARSLPKEPLGLVTADHGDVDNPPVEGEFLYHSNPAEIEGYTNANERYMSDNSAHITFKTKDYEIDYPARVLEEVKDKWGTYDVLNDMSNTLVLMVSVDEIHSDLVVSENATRFSVGPFLYIITEEDGKIYTDMYTSNNAADWVNFR